VPAVDLVVQVLQEADPARVLVRAVAGQLDEVERVVDRERAREVGDERDRRLERADQQRLEAPVVVAELGAELLDARSELGGLQEDLADPRVVDGRLGQDAFWNPKRAASRSKSRS
jgi:hypothetical protein